MKKFSLRLLFAVFCLVQLAEATSRLCLEKLAEIEGLTENQLGALDAIHPRTSSVLGNFMEIARIFRPSGHEAQLRDFLIGEARRLGHDFTVDQKGNLLVRIPSNIKGGDRLPWVAIQGHMDMVPAVEGISSLKEAEEFFRTNGGVLPLAVSGDFIHTKNFKNSNGFDNGSALAIMLEYMRNPELPHPPLELVFTVEEETGLLGAAEMTLPLRSKKIISLDSGREDQGLIGSQGSAKYLFHQNEPPSKELSPELTTFNIKVTGFRSGHSGVDIGEGRANAVLELRELLSDLQESLPSLEVLSLSAGVEGIYNAIPSTFSLSIAIAAEGRAILESRLKAFQQRIALQYEGIENPDKIVLQGEAASRDEQARAFERSYIKKLMAGIGRIPNGLRNDSWPQGIVDPVFSSNLGFLRLDSDGMRLGLMPRFQNFGSFELFARIVESVYAHSLPELTLSQLGFRREWNPSAQNALRDTVEAQAQLLGYPMEFVSGLGGVELGPILARYPDLEGIVIGATLEAEHSPEEKMLLPSLARSLNLLDHTLQSLIEDGLKIP